MKRKKKIKRKNKFWECILSMFICITAIYMNYLLLDYIFSSKHKNCDYEFKEYIISEDERLWDIAENELENNAYYKGEDIRQIIYEIEKDNNISSKIYEGQTIKIRIKKDELSTSTDQSDIDNTSSQNKLNQN